MSLSQIVVMKREQATKLEKMIATMLCIFLNYGDNNQQPKVKAFTLLQIWHQSIGNKPTVKDIATMVELGTHHSMQLSKRATASFSQFGLTPEAYLRVIKGALLIEARVLAERILRPRGAFRSSAYFLDDDVARVIALVGTRLTTWDEIGTTEKALRASHKAHRS